MISFKSFIIEEVKRKASEQAYDIIYEQMEDIKDKMMNEYWSGKYKYQPWKVIPINIVTKIWKDFTATGIVRDNKGLDKILQLMIENTTRLHWNNVVSGHETYLDKDEFIEDVTEKEWEKFVDWCIELPGGYRISDYGMNGLVDNLALAIETKTDEERIVYMDMFLNVCHQRSDLSEWFVQGGRNTLNKISLQGDEE